MDSHCCVNNSEKPFCAAHLRGVSKSVKNLIVHKTLLVNIYIFSNKKIESCLFCLESRTSVSFLIVFSNVIDFL